MKEERLDNTSIVVVHRNRSVYKTWSEAQDKNPLTDKGEVFLLGDHQYKVKQKKYTDDGQQFEVEVDNPYYIYADVRAISATQLGKNDPRSLNLGYNVEGIKSATKLFLGLPLKTDHNLAVKAVEGKVVAAWWSDSERLSDGTIVPPGINVRLAVDRWSGIADGLMDGTISAVSATIKFDMEQSHAKMTREQFMRSLGTTVDGKLVTRNVNAIKQVVELSAVQAGFDPYARVLLNDGGVDLLNGMMLSAEDINANDSKLAHTMYEGALADGELALPCVEDFAGIYSPNSSPENMANTEQLQLQLTTATEQLTAVQAQLVERENELNTLRASLAEAQKTRDEVSLQVTALTTDKESLTTQLTQAQEQLTAVTKERDELADAERTMLLDAMVKAHTSEAALSGTPLTAEQVTAYTESLSSFDLPNLKKFALANKLNYQQMFWGSPAQKADNGATQKAPIVLSKKDRLKVNL